MDVSVRDASLPLAEGQSTFDAMRGAGVKAMEIWIDINDQAPYIKNAAAQFSVNSAGLKELKKRLADEGMRVSALLLTTDFSGEHADAHVDWAVRAARAARELGAHEVRLDTYSANKNADQHRDNFARRATRVLEQTRDTGIDYGIENHGPVSNDPKWLDGVFAAVGNPRLGMTLDTGNFYWWGHPLSELYRLLEHFAPRAKHTHVKNINFPAEMREKKREIGYEYGQYVAPLYEGDIEMKRVVSILKKAGYTRDLCVEDESLGKYSPEEQIAVFKKDARTLKDAIGRG